MSGIKDGKRFNAERKNFVDEPYILSYLANGTVLDNTLVTYEDQELKEKIKPLSSFLSLYRTLLGVGTLSLMLSWKQDYHKLNVMKRFKTAVPINKTPNEVVTFDDLRQLNKEKLEYCYKSSCRLLNYLNTAYKKYPLIRLIQLYRASGEFKCQRVINFEQAD